MSAPTLVEALRLVETLGLAPLARIEAARPKSYINSGFSQWVARRREVELEVAEKLRARGASVTLDREPVRVRFAGVTASSTMGPGMALRNWKTAAEKGLKHWGSRR